MNTKSNPSSWTNTAQNPSRFTDRPPQASRSAVRKLNVPECAMDDVMNFLWGQSSGLPLRSAEVLHVTHEAASTISRIYSPVMKMSFYKAGRDYFEYVQIERGKLAKGYVQVFECAGRRMHIAYFPKCGNLALLEEWQNYYHRKTIYGKCRTGTVSSPQTIGLFALGIASLAWIVRRRNKLQNRP